MQEQRCGRVMADDLMMDASDCLTLLHAELDGARLPSSEQTLHAPHAVALLSRMVHLCEAAIDVARTDRRPAAAVLLRPAIECWIDCCYVLYCKSEAVLQLVSLGLREREKLAKIWLGDEPVEEIVEQLAGLDAAIALGREAGMLHPKFTLRTKFQSRLGSRPRSRAVVRRRPTSTSTTTSIERSRLVRSTLQRHWSSTLWVVTTSSTSACRRSRLST